MNEPVVRLVCFELYGEAFAFNMEYLIEIVQIRASEITPCFTPIPFVRGTWMYRTRAIYVIDVGDFFHLAPGGVAANAAQSRGPATPPIVEGEHALAFSEQHDEKPARLPKEKRDKSMLVVRIHDQVLGFFSDAVLQVVPLGIFYEYPDVISTLPRQYFAGIIRVREAPALVLALDELLGEYDLELLAGMEHVKQFV